MKRYIAFVFETQEAGGWGDVLRVSDAHDHEQFNREPVITFDSIEDAVSAAKKLNEFLVMHAWEITVQIVDLHKAELVAYLVTKDGGTSWENIES